MTTHRTPDPWANNLRAPRSLRAPYADLPPSLTRDGFTAGERLVCWAAGIGYLLVVAYIYRAELCAMLGG